MSSAFVHPLCVWETAHTSNNDKNHLSVFEIFSTGCYAKFNSKFKQVPSILKNEIQNFYLQSNCALSHVKWVGNCLTASLWDND